MTYFSAVPGILATHQIIILLCSISELKFVEPN